MVTDMVKFSNVLQVAEDQGKPQEFIDELRTLIPAILADKQKRKRQPREPAPEGGISICAASRKYDIPHPTICRWVKLKYITVIKPTDYETFIDEARMSVLARAYHSDPRQGSWAVKKLIQEEESSSSNP